MPDSEILTPEELAEVTGYKHTGSQREWLAKNGWHHVLNAAAGNRQMIVRNCMIGRGHKVLN